MKIRPAHIRIKDDPEWSKTHIEVRVIWVRECKDRSDLQEVEVAFMLPRTQKPLDEVRRDAIERANQVLRETIAPPLPSTSVREMKQREKMRELFRLYPGERARVIEAYAQSEQRGEVTRARNNGDLTPHDYAYILFADGISKGWIYE